jgi:deoxyadenosine/deoxycytidine kinase
MPFVVVVDGIISAGKTTYINMLLKNLINRGYRVTIVKEPVDEWTKPGKNGEPSLLARFYSDPKRWAYHFQTMAFHDRVQENIRCYEKHGNDSDIFILERSMLTDNLFMEMLYENKTVDELEYTNYQKWWSLWRKVMPYEPNLIIYLKPSIDECMSRLRERNRCGEKGVSLEYQELLQKKHNDFFANKFINIENKHYIPCVTLQTDKNFRDDSSVQEELTDHFETIFKNLNSK